MSHRSNAPSSSARRLGTNAVVALPPEVSIAEVASRMAERNVGSVVLVRADSPVGILTDRDLVLRVLREGKNAAEVTAEAVMSVPVQCLPSTGGAEEAAALMREHQIRRLPIVDSAGRLVGIVTLDDLLDHVGRTNAELARTVASFPVQHFGG